MQGLWLCVALHTLPQVCAHCCQGCSFSEDPGVRPICAFLYEHIRWCMAHVALRQRMPASPRLVLLITILTPVLLAWAHLLFWPEHCCPAQRVCSLQPVLGWSLQQMFSCVTVRRHACTD